MENDTVISEVTGKASAAIENVHQRANCLSSIHSVSTDNFGGIFFRSLAVTLMGGWWKKKMKEKERKKVKKNIKERKEAKKVLEGVSWSRKAHQKAEFDSDPLKDYQCEIFVQGPVGKFECCTFRLSFLQFHTFSFFFFSLSLSYSGFFNISLPFLFLIVSQLVVKETLYSNFILCVYIARWRLALRLCQRWPIVICTGWDTSVRGYLTSWNRIPTLRFRSVRF